MIKEVIIPKEYKKRFLIKENSFKFDNDRLILLYGCNGIGKSSILDLIANKKKSSIGRDKSIAENYEDIVKHTFKETPKIAYWKSATDTSLRNKNNSRLQYSENIGQDLYYQLYSSEHSEGESLTEEFLHFLTELKDVDLLLIDELDSGLSIGNINICFGYINDFLINNPKAQVIMAINNYQWIHIVKKIYRMDTGRPEKINNYDDFVQVSLDVHQKYYEVFEERRNES